MKTESFLSRYSGKFFPLTLILGTLTLFLWMEMRDSRYFLWDDNATQFFCYYRFNVQSLLQGEIPWMLWTQNLGQTYLTQIQHGFFYPPIYLAHGLSTSIFKTPLWTIDLLAYFHLLGGAFGLFTLLGRWRFSSSIRWLCTLLYFSSPFFWGIGKSWIFISYAACYAPWIFHFIEDLLEKQSLRPFIILIFLKVFSFLQGYPQLWFQSSVLELAYFIFRLRSLPSPNRLKIILSYLSTYSFWILLTFPILWTAWEAKEHSYFRSQPIPLDQISFLRTDPWVWIQCQFFFFHPHHLFQLGSELFFLGGFCLFPFLLLKFWISQKSLSEQTRLHLHLLVATIALSVAFYILFARLPIFSSFRNPFKWLILAPLFWFTALPMFLRDLWGENLKPQKLILALALLTQLLVLARPWTLHPCFPLKLRSEEELATPWWKEPQRSLPVFAKELDSDSPSQMGFLFPSLIQHHSFIGYDVLLNRINGELIRYQMPHESAPLETLRADLPYYREWAVRYYPTRNTPWHRSEISKIPGLHLVFENEKTLVFEDPLAKPMVYLEKDPSTAIPFKVDRQNLFVFPHGKEGPLHLRFAAIENLFFQIDDRPPSSVKTGHHSIQIEIPEGCQSVRIFYQHPFMPVAHQVCAVFWVIFGLWAITVLYPKSGKKPV
jgi:hypothetical protein